MHFSPAESTKNDKHHSKKQDSPLKYNEFSQTDDNDLKMSANNLILDLIKKKRNYCFTTETKQIKQFGRSD